MKKLGVNERVTHCVSHFFVEVPAAYPLPLSCNIVFALNPSDGRGAGNRRPQANAFHVFKRRVLLPLSLRGDSKRWNSLVVRVLIGRGEERRGEERRGEGAKSR